MTLQLWVGVIILVFFCMALLLALGLCKAAGDAERQAERSERERMARPPGGLDTAVMPPAVSWPVAIVSRDGETLVHAYTPRGNA